MLLFHILVRIYCWRLCSNRGLRGGCPFDDLGLLDDTGDKFGRMKVFDVVKTKTCFFDEDVELVHDVLLNCHGRRLIAHDLFLLKKCFLDFVL